MNKPSSDRPLMQSAPGPETVIDGRRYIYFGGTSYLGLHGHSDIIEAACEATRTYGIHTATSRRGFGNNPPTLEVERLAARYFGADDSFYFVSGYLGTPVILHALGDSFDVIVADENSHFSMLEAAPMSGRAIHRFQFRNAASLAETLRLHVTPGQRPLVLSDGVFASSGAIAPIDDYVEVLKAWPGSAILIDDAHGVGTLGENGRGTLEYLGLSHLPINAAIEDRPEAGTRLYFCGTLSKALGGFGGIVAGTAAFMERIRSASHYFDAASAPPSPVAAASARALEMVMATPGLRARLHLNVERMRRGLRAMGVSVADTPTPIVSAQCGTAMRMQRLHEELRQNGFLVPYVRSYSGVGPEGHMRIAVCAGHTDIMIDGLLAELKRQLSTD